MERTHRERYFRAHSVWTLLGSSIEMYARHFVPFLIITGLPLAIYVVLVIAIVLGAAFFVGQSNLALLAESATVFVGGFVTFGFLFTAQMYAVSEIVLGNKPSVLRAFRRAANAIVLKMMATNLLQIIVLTLGFLLLLVPGIVFAAWYYVAIPIVVFEGKWGPRALSRSRELAKGFSGRTVAITLLAGILMYVFLGAGFFASIVLPGEELWISGAYLIFSPMIAMPMVLTYYDLRLRKEGYDIAAFTEDLID